MAVSVIEAGGTQAVDVTGSITANAGFTISNVVAVRHKSILQMNFVVTRNEDTAGNATINIGTLSAGFRPKINSGVATASFSGIIGTNGEIYLRPFQRIPANTGESVCFMMLV